MHKTLTYNRCAARKASPSRFQRKMHNAIDVKLEDHIATAASCHMLSIDIAVLRLSHAVNQVHQ